MFRDMKNKKILNQIYKKISRIFDIILYSIGLISIVMLIITILLLPLENIDAKVVVIEYLLSAFICILYLLIFKIKASVEYIWRRNDIFGLITCTLCVPILVSCLFCIIMRWGVVQIEVSIMILSVASTIAWFIIKYKRNKSTINQLYKTIQIMTTFVTLVGIALTDIPNIFLRGLFILIGGMYMVIECVFQNKMNKDNERKYIIDIENNKYEVIVKKIN